MDIIENIREHQRELEKQLARVRTGRKPLAHNPDTLYIGCIDARLDPIEDLGFKKGKALIHRTIGAVVAGLDKNGKPYHVSEAATVQFAVNVKKVKRIIVSGHTGCTGVDACMHAHEKPGLGFLKPFHALLKKASALYQGDEASEIKMDEQAVRDSIERLKKYPSVMNAMKDGLEVKGWLLNSKTKAISEMDNDTGEFRLIRKGKPQEKEPIVKPEMLYIGCVDARLDPVKDIGIGKGKALIHRTIGAIVAGLDKKGRPRHLSEAASIEYAVKTKDVKHIVVSAHTCCGGLEACLDNCTTLKKQGIESGDLENYLKPLQGLRKKALKEKDPEACAHAMEEASVRQSIEHLRTYDFVRDAEKDGKLQLHGWIIDTATKRISEMGIDGKFAPMGQELASGAAKHTHRESRVSPRR